jgi:hypothetical protein
MSFNRRGAPENPLRNASSRLFLWVVKLKAPGRSCHFILAYFGISHSNPHYKPLSYSNFDNANLRCRVNWQNRDPFGQNSCPRHCSGKEKALE